MTKKFIRKCGFFVASSLITIQAWAAPLDIQSFSSKNKISPIVQKDICAQQQSLCAHPERWKSVTTADQHLWLLADDQVAVFTTTDAQPKLLQHWKIDLTQKLSADQIALNNSKLYVYPKLFPIADNRFAIARIHSYSELYSGGGATMERANFYELLDNGKTQQFIGNYPFSLKQTMRACFSEQDYKQAKGNCHDEYNLAVSIRPLKAMQWQFRYNYSASLSGKNPKTTKSSRALNIDLNRAPKQPNIPKDWNYSGIDD